MSSSVALERRLLQVSTLSALCFALLGVGFGSWIGSLVIVFDGAYSLVSVGLTLLSLAAASYIHSPQKKGTKSAAKMEPMVIAVKGFAIALMCGVSFTSAILAILNGGREVDAGFALIFGAINIIGCALTFTVMKRYSKKSKSKLVAAEAKQWFMDGVISAAVMVGFLVALILGMLGLEAYAVYADPVMVVLASLYFIVVPVKMIIESVGELQELNYRLS